MGQPEQRRVAFGCGGTAGHVYPAVAIADAYRQVVDAADLLFIGTRGGFEARLVPSCGYRLELVQGGPLFGVGTSGQLRAVGRLLIGTVQARRLLKAHGTQLVIGLGGYASAAAVLAARSLGLLAVIHEGNIVPGLTNRLMGRFAHRVHLGFESTRSAFPEGRCVVTGVPVRSAFVRSADERRSLSRAPARPQRILVTGGSRGSRFLNERVPDLLRRVVAQGVALEVRHQAGDADTGAARAAYQRANVPAAVTSFIDDMPAAHAWADFALACAGAGTLAELAASGLPGLLVPLSGAAADHQVANAAAFTAATATWWVREDAWDASDLAKVIASLLEDDAAYAAACERVRRLATPDAARAVAINCETLLATKPGPR